MTEAEVRPAGEERYTLALDKFLVLVFLGGLLTLGIVNRVPFFEPFGRGRLTYMTVWAMPVLLGILLVRRTPSRQWREFVWDWWPMVGVLAVYESLKHMHANRLTEWLGITPKDELMLRIDEWLFFGKTLPLYMDTWTAPWFIRLMTFCYIWVYYLGPVVLLGYAYVSRESDGMFRRLRLGLILGLLGGYVIYLLVPVAGPMFLVGDQFTQPIPTQPKLANLVFDTLRFNWDCFPSLHTAIPWILTCLAWRRISGWGRALCVVLSCGVTLSTVALRFHYGIDLIAAFVWTWLVYLAVEALEKRDYGNVAIPTLPGEPLRHGISQWPAIVGAWSVYGAALLLIGLTVLLATPVSTGQRLAVMTFLLLFLVMEAGILVLLNGVVEALTRAAKRPRLVDGTKAVMLAGMATLLVASLLKYGFSGGQLRLADLPLLSGVLPVGLRLMLGVFFLVAAATIFRFFGRSRGKRSSLEVRTLALPLLLAGMGAAFAYSASPAVRSFVVHVVPEFHWLHGAPRRALPPAAVPSKPAGAPGIDPEGETGGGDGGGEQGQESGSGS